MSKRVRVKLGLIGLLPTICLLLLLGGLSLLSPSTGSAAIDSGATNPKSLHSKSDNKASGHRLAEAIAAQATVTETVESTETVEITATVAITTQADITGTVTPTATVAITTQADITGTVTPTTTVAITTQANITETITPIPTETHTSTPVPTATHTPTPTPTPTPTETHTPTPVAENLSVLATPPISIATIAPTPTPISAPALLSFESSAESIIAGEEVVLRWNIVSGTAITLSYDSVLERLPISTTTFTHSPLITTVYTLTVGSSGGKVSKRLTVGVSPYVEPTAVANPVLQSPLDPPLESPLDPPLESPLDLPTETPTAESTETPTPTPEPSSTNTAVPADTAIPTETPTPTRTLMPTPQSKPTTKPIGLILTPRVAETSAYEVSLDGQDLVGASALSNRLRYLWYYVLVSLCILLPLLLFCIMMLFWWIGDWRVRYADDNLFDDPFADDPFDDDLFDDDLFDDDLFVDRP